MTPRPPTDPRDVDDQGTTLAAPAGRPGYRRSAGSPRGEARRQDLLDRVTDDLAVNGLVDFSLRRAARAAGTTHKVLLYHFDGADDLLKQAIFAAARAGASTRRWPPPPRGAGPSAAG